MAREELAYTGKDWSDLQAGGTPIMADDMDRMETGIANATAAINKVDATVLTYLVASGGDTATTDLNGAPITGPCYVEDLSNGNRWLDKGDGTTRVRTGVSVAEYEALRDSVSQRASITGDSVGGSIGSNIKETQYVSVSTQDRAGGIYVLVADGSGLMVWDGNNQKQLKKVAWDA